MVKFSSIFVLASIALGAVATPLHPSCSTEQVVNNTQGISSSCSALQIVVDNVDAATCNASAIVEALLPAIHNLVILITTATDDCKGCQNYTQDQEKAIIGAIETIANISQAVRRVLIENKDCFEEATEGFLPPAFCDLQKVTIAYYAALSVQLSVSTQNQCHGYMVTIIAAFQAVLQAYGAGTLCPSSGPQMIE